ncbi:hypothetical protein ACOME3_010598 [Neoechinorhynchus agilis]
MEQSTIQSIFPEYFNFVQEENNVLEFWKEVDAFETQTRLSKSRPRFTFYDGPPFATGLPHYGHLLAGTVKDIVTRWAIMSGYSVVRRFGWDCHGLPIEYEIDKLLGIRSPEDIKKLGIAVYNNHCRAIAMKYASEWEKQVQRMGRWIDFKNDYKTLYPWYMESVWFVFKQLFEKGFVYRGVKVMPFSTACATPLSNFEANQNYKDVTDPSVILTFPFRDSPNVAFLAWTTTPWTLPSNMALCVNPDGLYARVRRESDEDREYVLMESRIEFVFGSEKIVVIERTKGSEFNGLAYVPLFSYLDSPYKVLCDKYVSDDAGTGIVHQAPFFGEDDFRVCSENGVVDKRALGECPIDDSGRFRPFVKEFEGKSVKEADPLIIKCLEGKGRVFSKSTVRHSYPFCWRSETPLIYKAVPCWFIAVEELCDRLLKNNEKVHWIPESVGEKRFGNWLRDAQDWCVSRNRYWGNPIPIWQNYDMTEILCVGSIEELKKLAGVEGDLSDVHREFIDSLTIQSASGQVLHRTTEVFDCWFESGAMPYAQAHYPFDETDQFTFPADFIAEGVDQTRGWFYTLLVLGTALFNQSPYKNVIVTGIIQAADGQKMSKRLRNYPDPMDVVERYGADAVRLYLINSPAVKADYLRFKEQGVREIQKDVFLPWYNSLRFLGLKLDRLAKEDNIEYKFDETALYRATNIMDRWILSFTQSHIKFVRNEMKAFRLYNVVPSNVKFIEILTNWYIRMNRDRLCGRYGLEDCLLAINTLFEVELTMVHLMASFTPFLSESFFQRLKPYLEPDSIDSPASSIHFKQIPSARDQCIDQGIEDAVAAMRVVIETGRVIRERLVIPLKQPLKSVIVVSANKSARDNVVMLEDFIKKELNVRNVVVSDDRDAYNINLQVEPNFRSLGTRARSQMKEIVPLIRAMKVDALEDLRRNGTFILSNGFELGTEDVHSSYVTSSKCGNLAADSHSETGITVLMDTSIYEDLKTEKWAREVMNRIQKMRKEAHLLPTDSVNVYYSWPRAIDRESELCDSIEASVQFISDWIRKPFLARTNSTVDHLICEKTFDIHDGRIHILIAYDKLSEKVDFNFVNLIQLDSKCPMSGCLILDNLKNSEINKKGIQHHVARLFGLMEMIWDEHIEVFVDSSKAKPLDSYSLIDLKHYGTLYVSLSNGEWPYNANDLKLKCKIVPDGSPCSYFFIERTDEPVKRVVLLENPKGLMVDSLDCLVDRIAATLGLNEDDVENLVISTDKEHNDPLSENTCYLVDSFSSFEKKTLYAKMMKA